MSLFKLGNRSAIRTSNLHGYSYLWIAKYHDDHDVGMWAYIGYFSVLVRWSGHSKGSAHIIRLR